MTDQAKPTPRPWRRFLRFSVRGMIVVVLVIGGWLGWVVRSAQDSAGGSGSDQERRRHGPLRLGEERRE